MGEYILYVIMLFIPIGGMMAYFLRKEGLPGKYISIIVILSLAIILSFPISMERLGSLFSLFIYVLLLAGTAFFLLKAGVTSFAMPANQASAGTSQFNKTLHYNSDKDISNDIENGQDTKSGLDNSTAVCQETSEEKIAAGIKELTVGNSSETDNNKEEENEFLAQGELSTTEEISAAKEFEIIGEPDSSETLEVVAEEDVKTAEPPSNSTKSDEELEPEVEETDQVSAKSVVIGEDEVVSQPGDNKEEIVPEKGLSQEQVVELIDQAFACRADNLAKAIQCFEEAVNLTSEYELKYLLTMELVKIYKESSRYNQALSILRSFIALPNHKSAIINEIKREINYITLLVKELDRLGLSDLPVSRIPRWVRLKIDGEMNPREFR